MRSAHARSALLAALALALGACSADPALSPAPPSLAGTVGSQQEPQLVGETVPASDTSSRCMTFDLVPIGTRWGAVPGHARGVTVHAENGISMSLTDYLTPSGSGTTAQYRHAVVDVARYDVLTSHALRLDTVGVVFDFTAVPFVPTSVTLSFADRSPLENTQVENSSVFIGQIASWPNQAGHTVVVGLRPFPNHVPTRGKVGILGDVDRVRVGGANDAPAFNGDMTGLWLDKICANRASGQQQDPDPL